MGTGCPEVKFWESLLVLEAGPALEAWPLLDPRPLLDSDSVPLLCPLPRFPWLPLDSKYPVDPRLLLELRGLKVTWPLAEPLLALVEPKVTWPALELGSPKVTRPIMELVARPPLDIRMPLDLRLRMDAGTLLGLLTVTRGALELNFWVLERVMVELLSTFLPTSTSSFRERACSRASSCRGGRFRPQLQGRLLSAPAARGWGWGTSGPCCRVGWVHRAPEES